MLRQTLLLTSLLLPAFALAASDPDDSTNVSDHPDIPRYPGYYVSDGKHSDFDSHEFTVGTSEDGNDKLETVEGRYWWIDYRIKEGAKQPSSLAVFRNYENAILKKGGKQLWKQGKDRATFLMPAGKGKRYIYVNAYDDGAGFELRIVEPAAMEQAIELSASEMKDALNKNGFVALYGITFDTGKDAIKPESEALLAEIVTLLKSESGLKLSVEGHTDNVGDPRSNKALSQKRAVSVMKWLTGKGIPASRLSTAGYGHEMPVADNRLEEGRAKNRRVELVKKK